MKSKQKKKKKKWGREIVNAVGLMFADVLVEKRQKLMGKTKKHCHNAQNESNSVLNGNKDEQTCTFVA